MVGRLVKKQDIRSGEKKLPQGDTGLLTAGEGIYRFGEIILAKSQPLQYTGDLALAGVSVLLFKCRRQAVIGIQACGQSISFKMLKLRLDRADLLLHGDDICLGKPDLLVDRIAAYHLLVLRKVAESLAARQCDIAAVGGQFPYDHLEKGGLPCAVWSDQGGFLVVFYMKGTSGNDHVVAEGFVHSMTCQYHNILLLAFVFIITKIE